MQAILSVVAVLGIGSIVAAFIGWRVAISNHRQAWINDLRDDIANFIKELEIMHGIVARHFSAVSIDEFQQTDQEKKNARPSLLFLYWRIVLRLNRTEPLHIELRQKLDALMLVSSPTPDQQKVEEMVDLSRRVLKREWEVTKFGMFANFVTRTKASFKNAGGQMNWQRGAFRIWIFFSVIWITNIALRNLPYLFSEVMMTDLFGVSWLPFWASITTHVQPYANPLLGTHPNPSDVTLTPSSSLVWARLADTVTQSVLPPILVLFLFFSGRWTARGFWKSSD